MTHGGRADRMSVVTAPVLLCLGGLTWVPARYGVMTTWQGTLLGLDYGGWNRLMLVPLLLLTVGAALAARAGSPRRTRIAWTALAAGFVVSAVGVAVEFVIGGGLQGGPESLALAGWAVYLLGQLVTAGAALVLAVALTADGARGAAAAAAVAGIATLLWPVAAATRALELADQALIGLAWIALGVLTAALSRRPASTRGSAPGAR